jgi:ZIP family zinc transporter
VSEFSALIGLAAFAGLAAFLGAGLAVRYSPSTFLMSAAFGVAGGVLIGTVAFDLVPHADELASLEHTVLGFAGGFSFVYALDLAMNGWRVAGPRASERRRVTAFHRRRHQPRGEQAFVLALGTSIEEIIEGIAIGVAVAVGEDVGVLLALAIAIDNVTEAFSVGAMIRDEAQRPGEDQRLLGRRIFAWSSAPGVSVFVSAIIGWTLLGGLSDPVLAVLLAGGGGALFYLAVTDFIPEAEERQYEQSAAIAAAAGFLAIYVLSSSI